MGELIIQMPRKRGKTFTAVVMCKKDEQQSVLLVHNSLEKSRIMKEYNIQSYDPLTVSTFSTLVMDRYCLKGKDVYIDNYDLMGPTDREVINRVASSFKSLTIFETPTEITETQKFVTKTKRDHVGYTFEQVVMHYLEEHEMVTVEIRDRLRRYYNDIKTKPFIKYLKID